MLDTKITDDSQYKKVISEAFVDSIKSILKSGRRVILIYPIPEVGWDVPMRLVKSYLYINNRQKIKPEDASTLFSRFLDRNKDAYDALDAIGEDKNLIRIKPEHIFCNSYIKGRCITHIDAKPLYFDDNHLSNDGADMVVREIMKHL